MSSPEKASGNPAPSRLGDYLLGEMVSEDANTRTYHAQQTTMDRGVILVMQKAAGERGGQQRAFFLRDVRTKAAIEHAGIGAVFEAGEDAGELFWTRALLPGRSFAELHEAGEKYTPRDIAGYLKQLGGAMAHMEERGIKGAPLKFSDIVLSGHGILRIKNLAVAGERGFDESARDLCTAGDLFHELLDPSLAGTGLVGATRVARLLDIMTGAEEDAGPSWTQIANTAQELEQSIVSEVKAAEEWASKASRWSRIKRAGLFSGGGAVVGILIFAFLAGGAREAPAARDLSGMIVIPGGVYTDHEGKPATLASFSIDAHEVTIGEYATFLEALTGMGPGQRKSYDHESQPRTKLDHLPTDWPMMLSAARGGRPFNGRQFDLNHPVTGVDWWDAHAYATWNGGRLPTLTEWLAVVALEDNVTPYVDDWGPVDQPPRSSGKLGIHGLAGNVAEWSRDLESNPSFPMNAKVPVACGGSFQAPASGASSRNWLSTRALRRPDLGFRIVKPRPPPEPEREQQEKGKGENHGPGDEFPLRREDNKT